MPRPDIPKSRFDPSASSGQALTAPRQRWWGKRGYTEPSNSINKRTPRNKMPIPTTGDNNKGTIAAFLFLKWLYITQLGRAPRKPKNKSIPNNLATSSEYVLGSFPPTTSSIWPRINTMVTITPGTTDTTTKKMIRNHFHSPWIFIGRIIAQMVSFDKNFLE